MQHDTVITAGRSPSAPRIDTPTLDLGPLPPDVPWDQYYEPFLKQAIVQGGATAVLAYSHHGALGLLRAAHDLGMSVPRDFSLVCFNDEPVVRLSVPSLTAVNLPALELGRIAADSLLKQMAASPSSSSSSSSNGDEVTDAPQRIKVDESLVIRESTAAPSPSRPVGAFTS